MKITICGSIAFIDEIRDAQRFLESRGHEVKIPPLEVKDENGENISAKDYYQLRKSAPNSMQWVWERKAEAMKAHFGKIEWADSILVLNKTKNNIADYIGANTLLEMGLAFHKEKQIYLLHGVPEISYKEEILGMNPTVLNGDLSGIC